MDFLKKLVEIESVSTDKRKKGEIQKAAYYIEQNLKKLGFQVNLYQEDNCPPLIIASYFFSSKKPTLGFYAHYDVQPADPLDSWKTPPFHLVESQGKFFGRGVADDKGHLAMIVEVFKKVKEENALKNNLVFIFEGEEEVGSVHFEKLTKKAKELKKVDAFYIVDMGAKDKKTPQIFYGLRGIVSFELVISNNKGDSHSGLFGNLYSNPSQVAAELFAKIKKDQTHQIFIPHFYDDVKKVSQKELLLLKKLGPFQAKIYPSFEINGWLSGYTGFGGKTIIPGEAMIKFSIRLVPNQKPQKIIRLVSSFIKKNLPKKISYKLKVGASSEAFYTDLNNKFIKKTEKNLKEVFENKPLYNRSGGSIPAAEILSRVYRKPVILLGFILPDSNLHAPNENFDKEMFFKGIESLKKIINDDKL